MHEIHRRARLGLGKAKTASRSAAAAARVHPAGFAVPSVIVVTAIVPFTFVAALIIHEEG